MNSRADTTDDQNGPMPTITEQADAAAGEAVRKLAAAATTDEVRALDQEFLHHARGNDGNTRLARRDVNENFFAHRMECETYTRRCASFSSSSAVSYSGRPITPE